MAKRYKCPYCNFSSERDKLIEHIGEEHEELIPEGYTPTRVVFNIVNKREYGVCMICKGKTEWNEKAGKYNKICPKESCHRAAREAFTKNMIKVYNKPTLLDDEEWQAHMLANRRISGKYKFSDGGSVTYTGSYEKKCLEFMDNVLNIPSKDIMCPGPTFEYEYMGNKHKWITDIYYIPANLVIEIKDGGNNPNAREMISYREKQIEKERMITNLGVYNYIRLTDNQFIQLIDILAELKEQAMNGEVSPISRINEAMGLAAIGGIANVADGDVFVGLYKSNTFVDNKYYEKMCLTKGMFDNDTLGIKDGILTNITLDENTSVALFKFVGNRENYKRLLEHYNKECSDVDIYEILSGNMMLSKDQIAYDKNFEFVDFAMPIIKLEGFDKSIIGETRLESLDKNIIKENYLISKDDIKFNFDSWKKNSDHNILYITGLSGSGKSTLAKKISKEYNAQYIEFDMFTLVLVKGLNKWTSKVNDGTYKVHPLILEYVSQTNFTEPPTDSWANLMTEYHFNEHNKFITWLQNRVRGDGSLYVLEGAQLFMNLQKNDTVLFAGEPLIITGTSMFKSWIRRYHRDVGDNKNIQTYIKYLKKDIPALFKYYFINEKKLQNFIKEIVRGEL